MAASVVTSSSDLGITNSGILEIMAMIQKSHYCAISAPTGSGKSTRLVSEINQLAGNCKIFITQPTVPGVDSLYKYMKAKPGNNDKVGKASDSHVEYNDSHKIIYVTAGHMERKIYSMFKDGKYIADKSTCAGKCVVSTETTCAGKCVVPTETKCVGKCVVSTETTCAGKCVVSKAFCDILILDEAHTGSLSNEIIMNLWWTAYKQGGKVPRLVLISATLDENTSVFPNTPFYKLETNRFPVEMTYSDKTWRPDTMEQFVELGKYIANEHLRLPLDSNAKGESWLVFCPGEGEIEICAEEISKRKFANVSVVLAFSKAPSTELDKIFATRKRGERCIIIGTNYLEASITIDDATYGFDSLTEKFGKTSSTGGLLLTTDYISVSSAKQREGRVGRTAPGRFYRMIKKEDFENENIIKPQREPEILRVPIHSTIMNLLKIGLKPTTFFKNRDIISNIGNSVDLLNDLGMVDHYGKPTKKGNFAPDLVISLEGAAIIWEWIAAGKPLFPIISLISLIECYGSYFKFPRKTEENSKEYFSVTVPKHYAEYFSEYDSKYDLEVLCKFWIKFITDMKMDVSPNINKIRVWCNKNSINFTKMKQLTRTVGLLINALSRKGLDIQIGEFTPENVLLVVTPIMKSIYGKKIFIRANAFSNDYIHKGEIYRLDRKSPITSQPTTAQQIFGIITSHIQNGKNVQRYISISHPLNYGNMEVEMKVEKQLNNSYNAYMRPQGARGGLNFRKSLPASNVAASSIPVEKIIVIENEDVFGELSLDVEETDIPPAFKDETY